MKITQFHNLLEHWHAENDEGSNNPGHLVVNTHFFEYSFLVLLFLLSHMAWIFFLETRLSVKNVFFLKIRFSGEKTRFFIENE